LKDDVGAGGAKLRGEVGGGFEANDGAESGEARGSTASIVSGLSHSAKLVVGRRGRGGEGARRWPREVASRSLLGGSSAGPGRWLITTGSRSGVGRRFSGL